MNNTSVHKTNQMSGSPPHSPGDRLPLTKVPTTPLILRPCLFSPQRPFVPLRCSCLLLVATVSGSSSRCFQPSLPKRMQFSTPSAVSLGRLPPVRTIQPRSPGRPRSSVFARLLSGHGLSVPLASAPPYAGATKHQPATRFRRWRHWHWGGLPLSCQSFQASSAARPSAVVGPLPGVARGPSRRCCTPVAAHLLDPFFPPHSSSLACSAGLFASSRRATSPSHGHAQLVKASAASSTDAQTADMATAQTPAEPVATPRQLRERGVNLTWSPRRLKSASLGLLASSMDPGHPVLCHLVVGPQLRGSSRLRRRRHPPHDAAAGRDVTAL